MDSLTPGVPELLGRLTARARAVIERVPPVLPAYRGPVQTKPVPWTWIPRRTSPVDAALSAQRRADREQLDADRRRCAAYPANPPSTWRNNVH
jgi:hypothetical protein